MIVINAIATLKHRMIASKIHKRSLIAFIHDFIAVIVAWWFAYLFRFNFEIPADFQASLKENLVWVLQMMFWNVLLVNFQVAGECA